jgi:hypothetical protein
MTNSGIVVYSITVSDIQEVARQEIERELSTEEIKLIQDRLGEKIHWYDAIAESIDELTTLGREEK